MEGTVALKWTLVARSIPEHAAVCSPLLPLAYGVDNEIFDAMQSARLDKAFGYLAGD